MGKQHVGWLTWGGVRPLYDDGTVGEPLNKAIGKARRDILGAFKYRKPITARLCTTPEPRNED